MCNTKSDPLAVEAVDMFLSIIGAEAGAMALRSLARGEFDAVRVLMNT